MTRAIFLISFLHFIITSTVLTAQPLGSYFHRLTTNEGLSQTNNAYICQDSRGFVWISSIDGLNRYDGLSVKVYRPDVKNPRSIFGQNVISPILEDDKTGDIWFCTYEALNCYRRQTDDFEHWQIIDPMTGDTIREDYYAFYLDPSGLVWMRVGDGGNGRLFKFNTRSMTFAPPSGALTGNRCYITPSGPEKTAIVYSFFFNDIKQPGLKQTHILTAGGTQTTTYFDGNRQPARAFRDLWAESDTVLWLGGIDGLTRFNPFANTWTSYPVPAPGPVPVYAIEPAGNNCLAVSTSGAGLHTFNYKDKTFTGVSRHRLERPNSLSADELFDMHIDANRNLWISERSTGLNFTNLDKPKIENIIFADLEAQYRPKTHLLLCIAEDRRRRVWCATKEGGVYLFKNRRLVRQIYNQAGLPAASVRHLYCDKEGIMWVVTSKGLFWYNESKDYFFSVPGTANLLNTDKTCLRQLQDGRRLLAHYGFWEIVPDPAKGGYRLSDSKTILHPALDNVYIYYFFQDRSGTIYCNANAGQTAMVRPAGDTIRFLNINNLKACYESPDSSILWMATTYGLAKLNPRSLEVTLYDESKNLPNQYLYSVIPDNAGFLWLSSNKGILKFDPKTGTAKQLSAADGVWKDEFYTYDWLRTASGEIWMGNRDAANVFHPDQINEIQTPARVQITTLNINDEPWTGPIYIGECTRLEFPHDSSTLSFEFVALEYSDPAANRLQYRLNGFDGDWLDARPGAPGFARYAKLPAGDYTFQVRAFNSDSRLNPEIREIAIRIHPPFWQRWWFIVLCILVFMLAVYGFYRFRLAQLRRDFDFRQKMANSEMKALRAQMNPHFIFNSLNSINAYILRNQGKTASEYLTQFAGLMRQILDNSAKETIPLEDELTFLESYLKAESIRLEENMEYDIRLDQNIDPYETEIPSMILQPYLENAVWHGVAPKNGKGKIVLTLVQEQDGLLIRIEDNGIGRVKAKALREARRSGHVSKGLGINRERLALFDQKHGTQSSVETTDLYDEMGHAAGTRVELRIKRPVVR